MLTNLKKIATKNRQRKRLAIGVLIALYFVAALVAFWKYWENEQLYSGYKVIERIPLSGTKEPVQVDYVKLKTIMAPAPLYIRVTTENETFLIDSLPQLTGLVAINTPEEALAFVRIPSQYTYAFDLPWEEEIGSEPASQSGEQQFPHSLTSKSFKAGGFTPPVVQVEKAGYIITRWIFVQPRKGDNKVQKIRELVGKDGSYRRTVLEKKPPPNVPDVDWLIPYRM